MNKTNSDLEQQVQKNVVNFCKQLPAHVDKWRSIIQESLKPLNGLINFCDQLRHVEKSEIKHMDNFEKVQNQLLFRILTEIEEEIKNLKTFVDQLNKANIDLKNKLHILEASTIQLDWDTNSILINGNATQPSLERILQDGLEFRTYFSMAMDKINKNMKYIDVRNENYLKELENAFKIDLNHKCIMNLLAITQYVDNEKSIT